jgi:hypothetical protein
MAGRGESRAATAAAATGASYEQEIDWEGDDANDGAGLQGGGGEGGDDPEDAPGQIGEDGEPLDEEELGEPEEPLQLTRGQNRLQRLANENARLKRDLDDVRSRIDRVSERPAQPVAPMPLRQFALQETDEQFNARIQLLNPEDRMEQRAIRSEQKAELRAAFQEFKAAQTQDKINWDASCATSDRRKRWSGEVETERERLFRQNGNYVDREIIYHWLLGKWMDSPAGDKRREKTRQSAERRVRSQEVRPSNNRSDVDRHQRGRLTEAQARAKRLENQQI